MTDADGSIVQPDYVMRCWCVTYGISLGWVGVGVGGVCVGVVVRVGVGVNLERQVVLEPRGWEV